ASLGDAGARTSGAKSAASFVSQLSGTSLSKAKSALQAAGDVSRAPSAARAFSAGVLSVDQAAVIGPVVRLDPSCADGLLVAARDGSFSALKERAARTRARLLGEEALQDAERALHARRYCRLYALEGGMRVDALLGAADAAALKARLDEDTKRLWKAAARAGQEPGFDQLRADALVSLVKGDAGGGIPHVIVHVDAAALRRGGVQGDERCEIQGVGPVSVAAARDLLGEGFFSMLVDDGADVATVTSMTRTIPRRLRTALVARDPSCVVPGCGARDFLEIDHWRLDFARHGPTELDNLCRLCSPHHRMKTRTGWRISGGPGRWRWRPPRMAPARAGP
ncbi:MAG: hypothetical protein ACRDWE_02025, partial [Acidimicrobiales bacterium]